MGQKAFRLEDSIVADSLDSVSSLDPNTMVVGGLSIQLNGSYLGKQLRRTPDVDFQSINKPNQDYEGFVSQFFQPLNKDLRKKGYQVQSKKGRLNNSLKVMRNQNKPDSDTFLLHWTKYDEGVYEGMKDYIARQSENSKFIQYDEKRNPVRTASLEEVLPLKLRRATRFGPEREENVGPLYGMIVECASKGDWEKLASVPLDYFRKSIHRMQNRTPDPKTYKLSKDVYDVCLASRIISRSPSDFNNGRYFENKRELLDRPNK